VSCSGFYRVLHEYVKWKRLRRVMRRGERAYSGADRSPG